MFLCMFLGDSFISLARMLINCIFYLVQTFFTIYFIFDLFGWPVLLMKFSHFSQ